MNTKKATDEIVRLNAELTQCRAAVIESQESMYRIRTQRDELQRENYVLVRQDRELRNTTAALITQKERDAVTLAGVVRVMGTLVK